jgi:hypothetical protein
MVILSLLSIAEAVLPNEVSKWLHLHWKSHSWSKARKMASLAKWNPVKWDLKLKNALNMHR